MYVEPNAIPWWSYILDHIHLAFWLGALGFVWRFRRVIDNWADSLEAVKTSSAEVEKICMATQGLATQIRDNHLTHLDEKVTEQKRSLEEQLKVLNSIDKNIAIMAERMTRRRRDEV